MKLYWTPQALADRDSISDFIAMDNPHAAAALDDEFVAAASRLIDFPKLGHPGATRGTREWRAHRSYRLIYRIKAGQIEVLTVVHAARQWPES